MVRDLRVSVLELPATYGESPRVLRAVDHLLATGPDADIVLLPEASLNGYVSPTGDFDLAPFAEPLGGPTVTALAAMARRHRTHLVAPLVLHEGEACFNAMVVLDPRGDLLLVYRKRHPWFPETWATPGPVSAPTFVVQGARVALAICFDVHFLADEAEETLRAADLLLFPSAWVDEEDSKEPLLADLAQRFALAVANANWAPGVVRLPGQGGSCILDRHGRSVVQVTPGSMRADAAIALEPRSPGSSTPT